MGQKFGNFKYGDSIFERYTPFVYCITLCYFSQSSETFLVQDFLVRKWQHREWGCTECSLPFFAFTARYEVIM